MNRKVLAACFLSLAVAGVCNAQNTASSPETDAHFTHAQAKQLERGAHAPEQYRALASYYADRQKNYLQKADDAKREWQQLGQDNVSMAAKYPSPAESARNRYDYYMSKASKAGELEARYDRLSSTNEPVNAQLHGPNL